MEDVATCSLSIDDVKSLTIPKLKAELTRLNQPIGGLKLKAQFIDALIAYIEQQQQQQPSCTPVEGDVTDSKNNDALEAEVAPDAVELQDPHTTSQDQPEPSDTEAEAQALKTVSSGQPAQDDKPAEPELSVRDAANLTSKGTEEKQGQEVEAAAPGTRVEEVESRNGSGGGIGQKSDTAEPTDVMDSGNDNHTPDVVEQEKEPTASPAKTPKTPTRKSRKRSTRTDEDESTQDGGRGSDGNDVRGRGEESSTPEKPKTKRSRRSSARGSSKPLENDSASGKREGDSTQETEPDDGNGTTVATTMGEPDAGRGEGKGDDDPMDVGGGEAPLSEPGAAVSLAAEVAAVKSLADGAEATEEGEVEGEARGAVDAVTIRVDNFVRPFTAPQAKKLVEEKAGAPVLEGCFWMDSIKTHCYATFDGQAVAERAIAALQGLQWPVQSFKRLEAKIGDISAEEAKSRDDAMRSSRSVFSRRPMPKLGPRVTSVAPAPVGSPKAEAVNGSALATTGAATASASGATASHTAAALAAAGKLPSPTVRGRGSVQAPGGDGAKGGVSKANGDSGIKGGEEEEVEPAQLVLEDMFRKTEVKPSLYWLPLSEEEVGERKRKMKEDGVGPRTTPMPADHVEAVTASSRGGGASGGGWGAGGADRRGYGGGRSGGAPYGRQGNGDGYYGRGGGGRRR